MIIVNDVITFQASDFSGLSDFAKSALQAQPGSTSAILAQLSSHVTKVVANSKKRYVQSNASENSDLASLMQKFAAASPAMLAAAADEIAALSAALT